MLICVGKVIKPFKQGGEVSIMPYTPNSERFKKLDEVLLKNEFDSIVCKIESIKIYDKKLILKFKSFNSRDDAIKLRGMDIMIREEEKITPKKGEFFIDDIFDKGVFIDNELIGYVDGFMNEESENPILRVKIENDYFYVPFLKRFVKEVSEDGIILCESSRELIDI
jgi:16S rRNA processing protein RimM